MTKQKIDRGGRRPGIPKKTIGFKVPVEIAEAVKEAVRPHVEKAIKKYSKN